MTTPTLPPTAQAAPKKKNGCLIALAVIGVIGVLGIGGCVLVSGLLVKGVSDSVKKAEAETKNRVDALATASPSNLRPDGELKKKFELMSDFTDVQRENAKAEFTGKIVEWTLAVFEVKRTDDKYRVQTSSDSNVGTFIDLYPKSDEERTRIEALKTGDMITVRGYINGTFMRNVQIEPAILIR